MNKCIFLYSINIFKQFIFFNTGFYFNFDTERYIYGEKLNFLYKLYVVNDLLFISKLKNKITVYIHVHIIFILILNHIN